MAAVTPRPAAIIGDPRVSIRVRMVRGRNAAAVARGLECDSRAREGMVPELRALASRKLAAPEQGRPLAASGAPARLRGPLVRRAPALAAATIAGHRAGDRRFV